jgi:PhoPQ-activated pathogenicity-related protein
MLALSLAKECYSMKLDLLTNATVVDDASSFVVEHRYLYFGNSRHRKALIDIPNLSHISTSICVSCNYITFLSHIIYMKNMNNLKNIRYNKTMDCPQILNDGNKPSGEQ